MKKKLTRKLASIQPTGKNRLKKIKSFASKPKDVNPYLVVYDELFKDEKKDKKIGNWILGTDESSGAVYWGTIIQKEGEDSFTAYATPFWDDNTIIPIDVHDYDGIELVSERIDIKEYYDKIKSGKMSAKQFLPIYYKIMERELEKIENKKEIKESNPAEEGEIAARKDAYSKKEAGGLFDFGRPKSAIARDRKYQSQEPHEQSYERKGSPKHPHYETKEAGGSVKEGNPITPQIRKFIPHHEIRKIKDAKIGDRGKWEGKYLVEFLYLSKPHTNPNDKRIFDQNINEWKNGQTTFKSKEKANEFVKLVNQSSSKEKGGSVSDEISKEDIDNFVNFYGFTDQELADAEEIENDGSLSEMGINLGYVWIESKNKWIKKDNSLYNEKEEEIVDHLRNSMAKGGKSKSKSGETKIESYLPVFPGFYNTLFQPDEERVIEDPYTFDDYDFKYDEYHKEAGKKATEVVEEWLEDFNIKVNFQEISSPREYNFGNDSINVEYVLAKDSMKKILDYLKENRQVFEEWLKGRYTSRSGFISSHSTDADEWISELKSGEDLSHKFGAVLEFIMENEGNTDEDLYYKVSEQVSLWGELKPGVKEYEKYAEKYLEENYTKKSQEEVINALTKHFEENDIEFSEDVLNKIVKEYYEQVASGSGKLFRKGGSLDLANEIKKSGKITEQQINLIKNRMNNNKLDEAGKELVQWIWDNTPELTSEQNEKGITFLRNLWKTPTGAERKNSPFGQREEQVLDTFKHFDLAGFHDTSRGGGREFNVPIYDVVGENGVFQYYYDGKVNIIGQKGMKISNKDGEINGLYDLRVGLGNETLDEKISRAIRDLFLRYNGEIDKNKMDKTITNLSNNIPAYKKVWENYIATFEIKEVDGKYVNPFVLAKGGKLKKYSDKFEEVEDLGNVQYYIRTFGKVSTDNTENIELLAVAQINDLEDAISDEELSKLDGKYQLDITLVPSEKYIGKRLKKESNNENHSISGNSVINLVSYMGGLNYQPQKKVYFETAEQAVNYLKTKELNDTISGNGMMSGFILDNQYNRAGNTNWQILEYMIGEKDKMFGKGGKILKEISTHKAVLEGDKINIYETGMPKSEATGNDLEEYPHWFKDRLVRSIPKENEDDLFAIFENYEEENRINLAEANEALGSGSMEKGGAAGKKKDNLKAVILIEKSEGWNREYVKGILRNVKGVVRLKNSSASPYTNHTALEIIVEDKDSAKAVVKKLKSEAGIGYVDVQSFVKESEYHLYKSGGSMAIGGSISADRKREMYLDYVNNFLTIEKFSEHYHISEEEADGIINEGRIEHEKYVEKVKNGSMATGGGVGNNYDIKITENTPPPHRGWKGIVSEQIYNRLEELKNQDGFLRYNISLYDDKSDQHINKKMLKGLDSFLNEIGVNESVSNSMATGGGVEAEKKWDSLTVGERHQFFADHKDELKHISMYLWVNRKYKDLPSDLTDVIKKYSSNGSMEKGGDINGSKAKIQQCSSILKEYREGGKLSNSALTKISKIEKLLNRTYNEIYDTKDNIDKIENNLYGLKDEINSFSESLSEITKEMNADISKSKVQSDRTDIHLNKVNDLLNDLSSQIQTHREKSMATGGKAGSDEIVPYVVKGKRMGEWELIHTLDKKPKKGDAEKHRNEFNDSLNKGGANEHLGINYRVTDVKIVNQKTGEEVDFYKAPMFETFAKGGTEKKEIFTISATDSDNNDESVDRMPITTTTYYSEDEAVKKGVKLKRQEPNLDVFINYGEYQLPSGDVHGDINLTLPIDTKGVKMESGGKIKTYAVKSEDENEVWEKLVGAENEEQATASYKKWFPDSPVLNVRLTTDRDNNAFHQGIKLIKRKSTVYPKTSGKKRLK